MMANQEGSPDFSLNLDGITDFPYFQHRTLPTRDSIRLVRLTSIPLLFGIDEVQKLCTIETFTTQEAPPYIALSYTWGAPLMDDTTVKEYAEEALWIIANAVPEKTCAGVCNIPEFSIVKIGTNLRRPLLYFSDIPPKVIPYIWIDALCINQADLTERSQQVARMVDIYADCALAFIWLGGGSEHGANVSKVWDLHEDLYPASENNYYNGDHKPDRPVAGWTTDNMYARLHLEHKRKDHDWLNYVQFFKERTWFSRAWVFQEVVFAPKILYNCAGLTFDPVYVSGVAQFLKCTGLGHELTRVKDRQIGDQIALPWFQIGYTARIRLQVRYIGSLAFRQKIAATQTTDSATHRIAAYTYWAYMLIDVRSSDASDLRDKVYAIYGVIQKALLPLGLEPDPRIVPDYNRTVRRLYTDTMTVLLEEVPDIQFLSEVEDPSLRCTEGLPSWVPDFNFRRHQSLLLEDIYTQYNAACCGPPRAVAKSVIVTASSTPHLILKGVQVGVISQIHDTLAY